MAKIIGLIGYVNKSDFIINLAKVLTIMEKRVLVIDATIENRLKYTLPTIENDKQAYITSFDEVDYAVGFAANEEITKYLSYDENQIPAYDYILMDIDNALSLEKFKVDTLNSIYLFMEYRNMSIQRNVEILKAIINLKSIEKEIPITKVLYRTYLTRVSEKYYESKIEDLNIQWTAEPYEFAYEDQDRIADIESEQSGYVQISKHTREFQDVIINMSKDIIGNTSYRRN